VPDRRIDAVRGCVAVERGPIVLCAESVDLPGGRHVDVIEVDPAVPPRDVDGSVVVSARFIDPPARPWPYADPSLGAGDGDDRDGTAEIRLSPYHEWATRGPSTMRVWLPTFDGAGGGTDR